LVVCGCCACGGGSAEPASSAPELDSCSSHWHEFSALGTDYDATIPDVLRWQDGTLYYDQVERQPSGAFTIQLVALPEAGGTPTVIFSDPSGFENVWLESDRALFARADQLYQVPISGGMPELIADGHTFTKPDSKSDSAARLGIPTDHALGASYLYWLAYGTPDSDVSIWRLSRAGDTDAEMLGTVSKDARPLSALVELSDLLIVAGDNGHAYTMSKSGGRARSLPAVANALLSGIGPEGVLWAVPRATANGGPLTADLKLSKASGGKVETFWPSKSSEVDPDGAWADNASSWIISAVETFADGERHHSLWSVDSGGHASRLACNPHKDMDALGPAVLTPEAAFVVLKHAEVAHADAGVPGPSWSIVRVPR
jgi:hypothetical protein